jgi:protein involved in ribonucleotide reduction
MDSKKMALNMPFVLIGHTPGCGGGGKKHQVTKQQMMFIKDVFLDLVPWSTLLEPTF